MLEAVTGTSATVGDPDNIDSDALAALSDPEYLGAAGNIANYFEENCGVEG